MPNIIRTSSLLTLLVLFSVAGFAQEKSRQPQKKTQKPVAGGMVITTRRPAEYDPAAWKAYQSEVGGFSILFPGTPQEETQKLKNGEQEVAVRILKLQALAAYSVIYLDGTPHNPTPEVARKLLDFSVKQASEMFQATVLQQNEITLDGHPGVFLMLGLPDRLVMRVKVYAVGGRIYQLMITTPPEQSATDDQRRFYEATANKFLDSFALAPVPVIRIPVVRARPGAAVSAPGNPPRAPISGGILNGKAISKPVPRYPAAARAAGVTGTVEVAVVVDEEGAVISAEALSGPDELREAAVEAARRARFSRTHLSGQPVKISGLLVYNFSLR
ncbi:MAG TPA: TonB family protein [Pyrinomonadaceae bacterium]